MGQHLTPANAAIAKTKRKPLSVLLTLTTARRKEVSPPAFPPPIITEFSGGFKMNDKNFYIQAISDLTERCNDLSLLDLIYKVFSKSMGADDEN